MKLVVVSGMAFEAKIVQGPQIETVYGLDAQKLTRDIEAAIARGATGLLSFGVAAGLAPSLKSGAIVIAKQVHCLNYALDNIPQSALPPSNSPRKRGEGWQETCLPLPLAGGVRGGHLSTDTFSVLKIRHPGTQIFPANEAWANVLAHQLPDAMLADVAGVDEPITSAEEKAALHKQFGTVVADMESHHVARLAQKHGLPFAVLRVVLDDTHCTLPPAALAATKRNGRVNVTGLFGSIIAEPRQIPALLKLGSAQKAAKRSLLGCCEGLKDRLFGLMDIG